MLLPIILTCSAAATGLGLLVATLVDSEAQVSAYSTSVVILLAGISGCFMPRDWLPETVQTLSLATPHAWALIGYDEVLTAPRPKPRPRAGMLRGPAGVRPRVHGARRLAVRQKGGREAGGVQPGRVFGRPGLRRRPLRVLGAETAGESDPLSESPISASASRASARST